MIYLIQGQVDLVNVVYHIRDNGAANVSNECVDVIYWDCSGKKVDCPGQVPNVHKSPLEI